MRTTDEPVHEDALIREKGRLFARVPLHEIAVDVEGHAGSQLLMTRNDAAPLRVAQGQRQRRIDCAAVIPLPGVNWRGAALVESKHHATGRPAVTADDIIF